jgi:hypothetical protein
VRYIKDALRKSGESEGWNALLDASRLDISFEDMVFNAVEPISRALQQRGPENRSAVTW